MVAHLKSNLRTSEKVAVSTAKDEGGETGDRGVRPLDGKSMEPRVEAAPPTKEATMMVGRTNTPMAKPVEEKARRP